LTAEVAGEARLAGAVPRDPNDDMVIACAVKAKADYIVTRDRDLLVLDKYRTIAMTTPEHFAGVLRGA
jgi:predicted nucleic acid-binding protein